VLLWVLVLLLLLLLLLLVVVVVLVLLLLLLMFREGAYVFVVGGCRRDVGRLGAGVGSSHEWVVGITAGGRLPFTQTDIT